MKKFLVSILISLLFSFPMAIVCMYTLSLIPQEEVRFAIRYIDDTELKVITKSPIGAKITSKWTAYEDETGHVWYGKKF